MTDERQNEQGESVPLNWACTVCGYHVEGELPERHRGYGAEKEQYVTPNAPPFVCVCWLGRQGELLRARVEGGSVELPNWGTHILWG